MRFQWLGPITQSLRRKRSGLGLYDGFIVLKLVPHPLEGSTMRSMALAALLGSVALPCAAASITVYRDQIPPVIFVDGFLEFQDAWIFKDKTEGLKKAVVKLRSRGGQISAAIAMGTRIHRLQFETEVWQTCQSACGLIWLAGAERYLPPGTTLGFHQPKDVNSGNVSISSVARIAVYLGQLGLSDQAITFIVSAPPNEMKWITTAAEAEKVGISTHQ
jgi:hypothetical protein